MDLFDRILPGLRAYPDIHPMLVHFPVALIPVGFLLLALGHWRFPNLIGAGRLVFLLGVLSLVAAVATGLQAQELTPHGPGTLAATHRSMMLVAGIVALLLLVPVLRIGPGSTPFSRSILLGGLLLLNLITILGADRGALVALRLRSGPPLPVATGTLPSVTEPRSRGDAVAGDILYTRLACGSCHDRSDSLEAPGIPPSLASAGSKLRPTWIKNYLLHPDRIRWIDVDRRPQTRMPDFRLSEEEADDLTAALAMRRDPDLVPENSIDGPFTLEEIAAGRTLVQEYACRGCHEIGGAGASFGPSLDRVGDRLRPAYIQAFLLAPKQLIPGTPMKDFDLWENEARSMTAYLSQLRDN